MCALLALAACAEDAGEMDAQKAVTNAPPEFAVVCSNAWVKGFTNKASVGYKVGEDITFTLSFQGVTNAIPAGTYFYQWKRTGDDGQVEEGRDTLTKDPFTHTTKLEKPGFVRFSAEVVTADGKPFKKKVGKAEQRLFFEGGAGVALDALESRLEVNPRDFDAWIKELGRKVAAVPFKKVERTPVAAPDLRGQTLFAVSVPCPGERPVTGYLALPDAAVKGEKMPCRLAFMACGFAKAQPLPSKWDVSDAYVTLVMAYDAAPEAKAAEGYYPDLTAQILRALQYLKSIPEWNGRELVAHGSGAGSQLAVMAGGLRAGVTKVVCLNVSIPADEKYDPLFFARRIPSTCLVDIMRIGLGDDKFKPVSAALLWNALACEKKANWIQGAQAWTDQRWFKDRDVLWEKLQPVAYRDMTVERCKPTDRENLAFTDLDMALRDRIVFEAVVDPADLKLVNPAEFAHMLPYAEEGKVPLTFYIKLPEKRVKDKVWTEFVKTLAGAGGIDYPIYLAAGMDLPAPEKLPWYNVADLDGVLRYSGPDFGKAVAARRAAEKRVPPADPVFMYAVPKLFKAELGKPTKVKRTGQKLYKYIEAEQRKCVRGNPARCAEASHLLVGMRQARDAWLRDIAAEMRDRPGRAWTQLAQFLADWPEQMADPRVTWLQGRVKKNPEIEKMARLEAELVHLRDWKPVKNAEIKKRDTAVAAFRKKLEKYIKGKDTALQGEATLIQSEFDNPPPEPAAAAPED